MYRLAGFGSKRSTPEIRLDPICFVLDLDQVKLIQFLFFGFWSSRVDPIFFVLDLDQVELIQYFLNWIWIKSSWSNIFCNGFGSSRVDPIFIFWIFLKWRDIFRCTRIRYFFVGSSPAALWRPCASLISALTKLDLAPRTNTSLSLPTLLNIKIENENNTFGTSWWSKTLSDVPKKTSKIHDSYVRKMILPPFFIIF